MLFAYNNVAIKVISKNGVMPKLTKSHPDTFISAPDEKDAVAADILTINSFKP